MDKNLEKIKKIAKDVYKTLGSGHSEDIYEKAMCVDLRSGGIKYEQQRTIEVSYKDHHVGTGRLDIVTIFPSGKVLCELKAVSGQMGKAEERQLLVYMKILGIKNGLLINFQQPGKNSDETQVEIVEVEEK